AGALVPEPWMMGEWPHLSASYWEMLDRLGVERIADELAAISAKHGNPDGRPILLDHDDPSRGNLGLLRFRGHFVATPPQPPPL
ncbi:MAG: hypothetical protein M3Q54_05150, partial [Actinomycetota bacterium]|nr:hypothetical protein [Actinomycetota bacterium]